MTQKLDNLKNLDIEKLGATIRFYRKQKGYTQAYVAEQIGITSQHYSKIERGEYIPSLQTFFSIVSVLEIDIAEMNSDAPMKISTTMCEILHHLERFNNKQQKAVLAFLETMAPAKAV